MNLIEGLQEELTRCRILLQAYKDIGQPGVFAATHLTHEIEKAETAITNGDTVAMLGSHQELKSCH